MHCMTDRKYLRERQYKDSSNLNARIQLHKLYSTNPYGLHKWVFDQLELPPNSHILEIGCGPGMLWLTNIARIPADWDITLSDLSPGMLEDAKHNLGDKHNRFHFEVADAQSLPLAAESFDAVIANHMLYHLPDRQKAFSEIRRVLRPGGHFYAATNGLGHMRELDELLHQLDPAIHIASHNFAEAFGLENGPAQLAHWFSKVKLCPYIDSLAVTDAAPLVAYLQSGALGALLTSEQLAQFTQMVNRELAQSGTIHIAKEAGLFSALKD